MQNYLWFLAAFGYLVSVIAETPLSTNLYLLETDKARLTTVIEPGFQLKDLSSVHYAVLGYKLTGSQIPKAAEICKYVVSSAGDGSSISPENAYYITTTWQALGSCNALPKNNLIKALTPLLQKEATSIPDLYYVFNALNALSHQLPSSAVDSFVKVLQAGLKKDDSLLNLGYTFHIAAELGSAGSFVAKRIEDVIVQADEVDGKYLQFEGGLSITSLLVNGIYKLSSTMKKKPSLTSNQVVKLANYFLSRLSVQTPKGVVSLLSSVNVLATNEFENPICITLADNGIIFPGQQTAVNIKVCDILGKPLPSKPTVTLDSAKKVDDNSEIVTKKQNFQASATDSTQFTFNFMDLKPTRGFYKASVSAGSFTNTVTIKVLTDVSVDYLEIGTADADQTTQPKLFKVTKGKTLPDKIEADSQQKLMIRFLLKDSTSKKAIRVHQAFVRLIPKSNDAKEKGISEIIFIAEPDASNVHKFDMPVGTTGKNFAYVSGDYDVELIVGDALLSNSFQWKVATVSLKFPQPSSSDVAEKSSGYKQQPNYYTLKPEIKHLFREPEKRPPVFVSNLFTGLCLAPVLLLLILWAKLGVNISNFPFSLSAIVFHGGLASIFVLFGIFWLKLNMFVTLRYLIGLGIITFLAGNKLLSHIAKAHKASR